jgi:type I restriction enzyme S subunit
MQTATTTKEWKNTDIGRMPADWDVVKLGDHLKKTKLNDPSKKPAADFFYIDVSSVSREYFKIVSAQKLKGKDAPSRARKHIQTGDIIFATVRPTLQRIAMIPEEFNDQICSTGYCVLRTNNSSLEKNFLFHYLCTDKVLKYVGELQSGASYPAIRDSVLFNMKIPFPRPEEQQAIARVLTTVQEAIAGQEALIDKFKELKRSMMNHLFTHGTKGEPTRITEIGEMPESWSFVRASEYCDSVRDGTHDSPKRKDKGKYLVTSKNIRNGKIDFSSCYKVSESDFEAVNKRSKVDDNDIIFSMIGTLGEVAFIDKYNNDFCIKNVGLFKLSSTDKSLFLFYWLQTKQANEYIFQNMGGSTQKYIALWCLRNFPVPIVDKKESSLIVKTLSVIDSKLEAAQGKLLTYQTLFKTLLHELMSGERRIKSYEKTI